jgi:peptide deformylase
MSELIKFDTSEVVHNRNIITQQTKLLNLVREEDPILKEKLPEFDFANPPVDPVQFASSLVETCKQYNGYGLSANQCGERHRVFVMGTGDEYVAFFNPKVVGQSAEEKHMQEACLSFPLLGLYISRPETIDVEYQTYKGESKSMKLSGLSARCFLHELDHMNGIVYTDRVKPLALQQGMKRRNKVMKKFGLKYNETI